MHHALPLLGSLDILPFGGALFSVHAGHDGGGGLAALVDHLLTSLTSDEPSTWNLLGGIETLGSNLHPLFLHFPIAFLFGFLLVELYGLVFRKAGARHLASHLLYLGAVGAAVTAISGLLAAESVPHGAQVHAIMEWHERAGITVAVLAAGLALWRGLGGIPVSTMNLTFSLLMSFILFGILFLGADLGGLMVYQHGVGVQQLQSAADHQHHLHNEDD